MSHAIVWEGRRTEVIEFCDEVQNLYQQIEVRLKDKMLCTSFELIVWSYHTRKLATIFNLLQ